MPLPTSKGAVQDPWAVGGTWFSDCGTGDRSQQDHPEIKVMTLAPWSLPARLRVRRKKKKVKIVLVLKIFQNHVPEEPWGRYVRLIQGSFTLHIREYHFVQKTVSMPLKLKLSFPKELLP